MLAMLIVYLGRVVVMLHPQIHLHLRDVVQIVIIHTVDLEIMVVVDRVSAMNVNYALLPVDRQKIVVATVPILMLVYLLPQPLSPLLGLWVHLQ